MFNRTKRIIGLFISHSVLNYTGETFQIWVKLHKALFTDFSYFISPMKMNQSLILFYMMTSLVSD